VNSDKAEEGYIRFPSSADGLEVWVKDCGSSRSVLFRGAHVVPGGEYRCAQSALETRLSCETIRRIAAVQGRHVRDEIERSENPKYMQRGLADLIRVFGITLEGKRILDFGCGAGAFALNLLRLGATRVTGVEVDAGLLAAASSRLQDFFPGRFQLEKIDYIDGKYRMPLDDGQFDLVWAHAVLEHVHPRQRGFVLRELWRVLRRDGLLVVDATPNRLWFREDHTSGLPLVNYLPLRIAAALARRFSPRVPRDQTEQTLLARGFRGCTYWEIRGPLSGAECINLTDRRKDLALWESRWRTPEGPGGRNILKKSLSVLLNLSTPVLSLLKIPAAAFLPWLVLVFRKRETGAGH
jgi:SAM-dependent methyltransferase